MNSKTIVGAAVVVVIGVMGWVMQSAEANLGHRGEAKTLESTWSSTDVNAKLLHTWSQPEVSGELRTTWSSQPGRHVPLLLTFYSPSEDGNLLLTWSQPDTAERVSRWSRLSEVETEGSASGEPGAR